MPAAPARKGQAHSQQQRERDEHAQREQQKTDAGDAACAQTLNVEKRIRIRAVRPGEVAAAGAQKQAEQIENQYWQQPAKEERMGEP